MLSYNDHPHRRKNILTGEWVLVSPHRTKRPWQGKVEKPANDQRPIHDPKCYLCPGNTRANGSITEKYEHTFVFTNDFAALNKESPLVKKEAGLLLAKGEQGICRVICFSPNHSLTLPEMELKDIEKVIALWQKEYRDLGSLAEINHVQIFENKGATMGCSNPHPHGQIWAQSSIPEIVKKKTKQQKKYFKQHQSSMLSDYLEQELAADERIILALDHFVALVPFWAIWPYEIMILPRRQMQHINQMTQAEQTEYAQVLKQSLIRLDNIFETSFPYSAGIHQAPTDGKAHKEWHWHMSFYPPLLRSATVKKFMVGYEMFAESQRDITAEMAAEKIRNLSGVHYKLNK